MCKKIHNYIIKKNIREIYIEQLPAIWRGGVGGGFSIPLILRTLNSIRL